MHGPSPPYLDCAATTPIDPQVLDTVLRYLGEDYGNAGSRTHEYGNRARSAVEEARYHVAAVAGAQRGDVIFTSGATESNNLAILGLRLDPGHIVTTPVEHHAVLEPVAGLRHRGFEVTYALPEQVPAAIRPDTRLVSVMHVNNETGAISPLSGIADALDGHPAWLHTDAAQGYGKDIDLLRHPRIDLISISGHKIHAPKGVGALISRQRNGQRPPLSPLMYGGGQERGIRPGTLPVHLIAGLGRAAELALQEAAQRNAVCKKFREHLLTGLAPLRPMINAGSGRCVPHILNLSIPGLTAEDVIEAWSGLAAISQGAACTSQAYTCSHVLTALGLDEGRKAGAVRLSWCHMTEMPDLNAMVIRLQSGERLHAG
ncbi:MAG: aminotransferase class V-fold PLP-dependent enzyme [Acidobacteria bacterium]|nr:aminotransferase class V-fold PLP-dependent enzyme [Acidobacteriota bacterium]